MKKKDCNFGLEWDYKGMLSTPYPNGKQSDWNQILMTIVNQVSVNINKLSFRGGATHIEINSKLLPLLKTMEYYNDDEKMLSSYHVVINEKTEKDTIIMYNKSLLENIDAIPIVNGNEGENGMITFTFYKPSDCSKEDVITYMRNLCGYIDIKNF